MPEWIARASFCSHFIGLVVALSATGVEARCTLASELEAAGVGIRNHLACRLALLVHGGSSCSDPGVPQCSDDAARRIAELVLGPEQGPVSGWTPKALRCQRSIALASVRFVETRLEERAAERRRAAAGRAMKQIARSCGEGKVERNAVGEELVRVGAPCSELLGAEGAAIDGVRLSRCLRAALEARIDEIAPAALRPNILLILTDDQRYDTLDEMPALSALAGESFVFSNAFVTNPVCAPSRASILSGRYSHHTGVLGNGDSGRLDGSNTIATWLEAVGYTNALFGKYLNHPERLPLAPPPGWHEWKAFADPGGAALYFGSRINENGLIRELGRGRYSTDWLRDEVLNFIRRRAEEPFFVVYAPFAPHLPALPAERHQNALIDSPLHRPPNWLDDVSKKPSWVWFAKSIRPADLPAVIDALRVEQLRTLLSVDQAVGSFVDSLEKLGLIDNTVIAFIADNGFLWGEHWLHGKFNPYEESIRVPYLLRYPRGFPVPGPRDRMVLNHDLAPTFAELAGAAIPGDLDGVSLVPLLHSANSAWREEFLIETLGEFITRPSESVRTERFKYIDTVASAGVTQELYDLLLDPYETNNVADDPAYRDVLAGMIARLDALRGPAD